MNARHTLALAIAAVALVVSVGSRPAVLRAQPTTAPAAPIPSVANVKDSDPRSTADLEAAALGAFDKGDFAAALPMLKNLAVRLREEPDRVGPLLEKVRVCEVQIAQAQGAPAVEGINAPRTPHAKPADGKPYSVELKRLGNFDYDPEKGGGIPKDVTELDGATLKLNGFMIPIDESDKITKFVLVSDLFGCCFGQPPQIQHTAVVICPAGKAVSYFPDEIVVTGKLKVAEQKDDGFVTAIFQLTADSIRPAAK